MSEGSDRSGENESDDGEKVPGIDWTRGDVDEFQKLWASMIGTTNEDLKTLGITLLIWMFEHVPNMKKLFKNFDANNTKDVLVSDEKFLKHAQRVVIHLNKLIKKLGTAEFVDDVRNLSQAHLVLDPQVTRQYFLDFRDRFHLLVLDMTGTPRKGRPATLWFQFLDAFCSVFEEEELQWRADHKKKGGGDQKGGCCIVS